MLAVYIQDTVHYWTNSIVAVVIIIILQSIITINDACIIELNIYNFHM